MESALNFILSFMGNTWNILHETVFHIWGFEISLFAILLGLTLVGFLFTLLLPFVQSNFDNAQAGARKVSERIKNKK